MIMSRVLMIGAGGVATVAAFKISQNPEVFTELMIASRRKEKCDKIVKAIGNPNIKTAQVDADDVEQLKALMNDYKPELVINLALPIRILPLWRHAWLVDAIILTRLITSQKTRHTLNTHGNGHTKTSLKKQDLQPFLGVVSTRV